MSVSENGAKEIEKLFLAMQARAKNLVPVWPAVGNMIAKELLANYADQGVTLLGHKWAPLSPKYRSWKVAHGYPATIEILTGATFRSLVGRPMQTEIYTPTSAEFGVGGKIAFWQQYGTKKMPARPLIRLTPSINNKANTLIAEYVVKGRVNNFKVEV